MNFCFNLFRQNDFIDIELAKGEKDLEKALELKEEGNKLFKNGQHKEARDVYTKSLQFCPVDYEHPAENKDFAIILANRSAALEIGKMFQPCNQDINMALKYGYPRNLQYKVRKIFIYKTTVGTHYNEKVSQFRSVRYNGLNNGLYNLIPLKGYLFI